MKKQITNSLTQEHPWANRIHWFDSIGSTNTEAKVMAQNGAPHGTVLIADRQTGGRGRMGRSFSSPPGMGIYLSVVLRPKCSAAELMHLTCAAAVAMCNAIETAFGFRPGVKWINDLIANGKKLGGILTELSLYPGSAAVDFAIVGIGINCHQTSDDFPPEIRDIAISLENVIQKPADRVKLAAAMIQSLFEMDRKLLTEKQTIMDTYKADCITLGQEIDLIRGEQRTPCCAIDLDQDGGLIVRYADGSVEAICSGEVSVRPR